LGELEECHQRFAGHQIEWSNPGTAPVLEELGHGAGHCLVAVGQVGDLPFLGSGAGGRRGRRNPHSPTVVREITKICVISDIRVF
jgi:hypothetical protein